MKFEPTEKMISAGRGAMAAIEAENRVLELNRQPSMGYDEQLTEIWRAMFRAGVSD